MGVEGEVKFRHPAEVQAYGQLVPEEVRGVIQGFQSLTCGPGIYFHGRGHSDISLAKIRRNRDIGYVDSVEPRVFHLEAYHLGQLFAERFGYPS